MKNFNSRRWKIKDNWKNKPGGMINSAYNSGPVNNGGYTQDNSKQSRS
jgi:hypothetical protein